MNTKIFIFALISLITKQWDEVYMKQIYIIKLKLYALHVVEMKSIVVINLLIINIECFKKDVNSQRPRF